MAASCPRCGRTNSDGKKILNKRYGTPFVRCENCSTVYVDPEIEEPALVYPVFENMVPSRDESTSKHIMRGIILAIAGAFALLLGISSIKFSLFGGLFFIVMGGLFLFLVFPLLFQKGISDELFMELKSEYINSLDRISDRSYLISLSTNGVSVSESLLGERHDEIIRSMRERTESCSLKNGRVVHNAFVSSPSIEKDIPHKKSADEYVPHESNDALSFCRFCGQRIPSDSVFCPCCGKKLA